MTQKNSMTPQQAQQAEAIRQNGSLGITRAKRALDELAFFRSGGRTHRYIEDGEGRDITEWLAEARFYLLALVDSIDAGGFGYVAPLTPEEAAQQQKDEMARLIAEVQARNEAHNASIGVKVKVQ